jgi:hypothetical protein
MPGQRGLVARVYLEATETHNRFLFQYAGEIIPTEVAQQRSNGDYAWEITENPSLSIEASYYANAARFINDYRLFNANRQLSGTRTIHCMVRQLGTRMGVFLETSMEPGQELLTDYGDGYWTSRRYDISANHIVDIHD